MRNKAFMVKERASVSENSVAEEFYTRVGWGGCLFLVSSLLLFVTLQQALIMHRRRRFNSKDFSSTLLRCLINCTPPSTVACFAVPSYYYSSSTTPTCTNSICVARFFDAAAGLYIWPRKMVSAPPPSLPSLFKINMHKRRWICGMCHPGNTALFLRITSTPLRGGILNTPVHKRDKLYIGNFSISLQGHPDKNSNLLVCYNCMDQIQHWTNSNLDYSKVF